ncbi:unnamed protein product, partial [Prorocentrum cordatum]
QFLTFQGDVPVIFYRLQNIPELYSYFVLDGVDPCSLWEFAQQRTASLPRPPEGAVGVACAVAPMGWSWAVFLARTALMDCLDDLESEGAGRVERGSPVPSFAEHQLLYWLYIDNYGGGLIGEGSDDPRLGEVAGQARSAVAARGLAVRMESQGVGLPEQLGVTIDPVSLMCRVKDEKLKDLVLAAEALTLEEAASPALVEVVTGHWAWVMMLASAAFAIPRVVHAWIHAAEDRLRPRRLWTDVIAELHALAALSVFFFSDLSLGWHSQACVTHASNYGYAVMSTAAAPDTLRSEAKWARQQGWGVQVDTAHSEQEWQERSKGDLFQEDAGAATGFRATGRPGMADLFAGTGTLAECFRAG